MSVFHDEVEIEDFEFDEETETYYFPCPCGDRFAISREDLENGRSGHVSELLPHRQSHLRQGTIKPSTFSPDQLYPNLKGS
uniref:Diphthamide biosynthesis protein 3 n=1 Tax=Neogobius melanostomus TaxID=47308 RepID=A0A8C6SJK5_9GOBI